MAFRYIEEVLTNPLPPLPAVVAGGILYDKTGMIIFGQPKTNKSMLAKQLAFCLATGKPWLGFTTTKKKVIYIQSEISPYLLEQRVKSMLVNVGAIDPQSLAIATNFKLKIDTPQGEAQIKADIKRSGAEVVILDPLYRLLSSQDERSIDAALTVCDGLKEEGKTIVIVHHARKAMRTIGGDGDFGGNEIRGPLIEQWADSILRLRGDVQEDERLLDFELRNATQRVDPIGLKWDRNLVWFTRTSWRPIP